MGIEDRALIRPEGTHLRITFRLRFEDGHKLAQLASDNDRTVSAELRRAVKLYLRAAAHAEARRGT